MRCASGTALLHYALTLTRVADPLHSLVQLSR